MSLQFHFGLGLASDRVRLRSGWEGNEPRQVEQRFARLDANTQRLALAINTYYPEVFGGYYLNRSIIASVQEILQGRGLFVVAREYFDAAHVLPVECEGSMEFGEIYVLANEDESVGSLELWKFDSGGGGAFYQDGLILDFAFSKPISSDIKNALIQELRARRVAVDEW